MDPGLADRVSLVTGGARGLGRATADVLVAEGARVVLSGRTQETLVAAVRDLGDHATYVVGDNAEPDLPGRLIATARETWGRLDGALVSVGGPPTGSVGPPTDERGTTAFASVFLGAVRVAREVAAELGDGGAIGFVLSTSVKGPLTEMAISNGLRPGLAMVAKQLADELGPRGIRVNGLLPGRVATERGAELGALPDDPAAAPARAPGRGPPRRGGGTARVRPAATLP